MHLYYRVAVATFIQFVAMSFLGVANALDSVISTCSARGSDCISNAIVSVIFFMLTVLWFGAIWILAFVAQEQRSRRLAYALIAVEAAVLLVASFNARHHNSLINLITSLADIALALWVIVIAYRLSRSKGGRIMSSQRSRRRRNSKPQ